ncbi:MAG: hypothetical protein Q7R75_02280 [bacterium]|nr:hypothetical protein [bacterium]
MKESIANTKIEQAETRDRKKQISDFITQHMLGASEGEKKETINSTVELYNKTKEIIAPMIVAFANHVLKQAAERNKEEKIVFVARDGIGPYNAAADLLKKFPDNYAEVTNEKLIYAYLTRKVVWNSSAESLAQYLGNLGVHAGDNVTIVDVGMYGTIIRPLKSALRGVSFNKAEYLISRTEEANGFIDDGKSKQFPIFKNIMGNPAVHFIEDTFSGPIQSPTKLEKTNGGWEPDTKDSSYPPEISAKRKFALLAIEDYVAEMEKPEIDIKQSLKKLGEFLSNSNNFKNLMVPHEK